MKIGSSTSKMSTLNSGEHLVNFINNASSSVKTVLSKPGCFKRNTNHRRFLQKQLRQNAQDNMIIRSRSETSKDNDKEDPPSPKQLIKQVKREKTIRKKRRYTPVRLQTPLNTIHRPPSQAPILIPSPMPEFGFNSTQQYIKNNNIENSFMINNSNFQTSFAANRHNFFPEHMVANTFPVSSSAILHQNNNTTPLQHYNSRKNSSSSASSTTSSTGSDDDFGFSEFLSGEDLMRSLEFQDLFIPDQKDHTENEASYQNELAYRAYMESERQMEYLAHLEAIEACYQARENELFTMDSF